MPKPIGAWPKPIAGKGASVLGRAGVFLAYAGEWDKGLALIDEAAAFDPHHPG